MGDGEKNGSLVLPRVKRRNPRPGVGCCRHAGENLAETLTSLALCPQRIGPPERNAARMSQAGISQSTEANSQSNQGSVPSGTSPVSVPTSGSRGIPAGAVGGAARCGVAVPVVGMVGAEVFEDGA